MDLVWGDVLGPLLYLGYDEEESFVGGEFGELADKEGLIGVFLLLELMLLLC